MKYLSKIHSLSDFFFELNERKIKYVVLRWFEDELALKSQIDIDLLVADEHFEAINHYLVNESMAGGIRVDLYGLSSNNGFNKTTYYPYLLARRILDSRVLKGNIYVPDNTIHLLSFIFHVIFHKAEKSGISVAEETKSFDNKYESEIKRIAGIANFELPKELSLTRLTDLLYENDWLPPVDWLRKSSKDRSIYLNSYFPRTEGLKSKSIFILRNIAKGDIIHKQINYLLAEQRIKLLRYEVLDSHQSFNVQRMLRGGTWGKGPYNIDGGNPYSIYILEDTNPERVNEATQKSYPYLTNNRFLALKNQIRELVQHTLNIGTLNCVHSTDDELEFLEYFNLLFPVELDWKSNLKGRSNRAHFSVINYKGQLAVEKKFKPEFERYFRRELEAYLFLQNNRFPFLPNLISYSKNSLIIELIHYDRGRQHDLLLDKLNVISTIPLLFWRLGCAHLDFHPGNCLVDVNGQLYILDYEFFCKYDKVPPFEKSFDLVGHPESKEWGIKGENPVEYINSEWKRIAGCSLNKITQFTSRDVYLCD